MPTYRIVKVEEVKNKTSKISYHVEKKFLFWFFPCEHKVRNHTWGDYKDFRNEAYSFDTEEKAREALLELKTPFYEKYKGYTIEKIINPSFGRYILICHKGGVICHYPESLQEVKDSIDKEEVITKKTVVHEA